MVKVYAVALIVGIVGLLVIIFGAALRDPGGGNASTEPPLGMGGTMAVAGLIAFGMGGLSAEYAPIDMGWPVGLALAIVAGLGGSLWARYARRSAQRS